MNKTLLEEIGAGLALPAPDETRALLEKAHVSRKRLAEDMGLNRVTVSRWINGTRTPRGKNLVAFVSRLAEIEATVKGFG
jgi:transcriptional regulator with XRE-family HTH domain